MIKSALMTEHRPGYRLAGAELYIVHKRRNLLKKQKNCTFLILKDRLEIDFERNICLAGKVACR